MSARTRKDWILWGALGCALVSTAHAEYTLATAAHFNEYVALAVPGALDLYVVRALQQRRDVFVAVLAMVAANVTSHLIAGGVLGVRWPVIAAVGAVAPLIVWRVYSLKYTRTRSELLWDLKAGEMSTPALETSTEPECTCSWWSRVLAWLGWSKYACTCDLLAPSTAPEYVPVHLPSLEHGDEYIPSTSSHVFGCGLTHPDDAPCSKYGAPDRVPDWMSDEYPTSTAYSNVVQFAKYSGTPVCVAHSRPDCIVCVLEYNESSVSVPSLPPEYAPSTVTAPVVELRDSDHAYLDAAREYTEFVGKDVSVRGLMRHANIGQDRATRLLAHLEAEATS